MICNKKLSEIDLSGYQVIKREFVREKKAQPDGLMTFDFGKPGRVFFDKASLEAIGNPEYIQLLWSKKRWKALPPPSKPFGQHSIFPKLHSPNLSV